ncbi:hypothetical protein TIFTF001_047196 [Ficus carica]|uniref:Uncharacterized protein n=1 Tax=Ficus carica TaxID=3494 RepID=A0AA87YR67_FICCA|nr:hypothetical protein TIFTF001_047196 [Ficus carica]
MHNQRNQELLPLNPEIERTFLARRREQQGLAGVGEIAERAAVNMANDGQQVNVNNLVPQLVLVDDRDRAIREYARDTCMRIALLIQPLIVINQGASSSGANVYHRPSHPPGFPSQQPRTQAMEASSSLENLIKEPQGSLPSNTEDPRREGKEHCKAILLRNGREIERREKPKAECSAINVLDSLVAAEFEKKCSPKMINEDDSAVSDEDEEASDNQVSWMESRHTAVRGGKHVESLELLVRAFKSHKPSVDEPPVLELKPLPTHLRDSGSRKKKKKKTGFTGHRLHFGARRPIAQPHPLPFAPQRRRHIAPAAQSLPRDPLPSLYSLLRLTDSAS